MQKHFTALIMSRANAYSKGALAQKSGRSESSSAKVQSPYAENNRIVP